MVKIVKEAECMKVYAEEEAITYQRKMMTAIPWLLPFEWSGEKELFYQKGQGLNLIQWLKSEKSEESILEVIDAFFQNYKEADAYLIDEEKMILDPEWIFWEETKKRLQMAYVPWDMLNGNGNSFIKRFSSLLWCAALEQKWQNERLILILYRMQIAVKHQNQPQQWYRWLEKEKSKLKERDKMKEQALDILTEEKTEVGYRNWFRSFKERFPFAVR